MDCVVTVLSTHAGLSCDESRRTIWGFTRGAVLCSHTLVRRMQRIAAQITAQSAKLGYALVCRPVVIGA